MPSHSVRHSTTTFSFPFIYVLTAEVVSAPQMTSQPVSSISLFSTALWDLSSIGISHQIRFSCHTIALTVTFFIIIIIIYPLTARVVGAPQMTSQPVSSISLFSTALWDLVKPRPFHSFSRLFCLPCQLPPFNVPCKMVLARPDELEHVTFKSLLFKQ